jgi:glutamate-1-semialdehyde 2,1-aminomutase
MSHTATRTWSERLHRVIPAGAHTYSRGDDQYPLNAPQILERGEGAYVWDPDGNRYLDYGMALRAVTLGYAYEPVNEAAFAAARKGNNLTRASRVELEAAERLVDLIPSVDMVKFAKNGSNVTTAAVKLARAYTGRKYVAMCAEHPFFSFDDWFIGTTPMDCGVPEEHKKLSLRFHYNDIDSLERLFVEHPNEIAGVILEPASGVEPAAGFLHKIRDLCNRHGAVYILDEMITGFRWHLQGAQTYFDVSPDLCTFGKGMANGWSVSAVAGRRDIMRLGGILDEGAERVFLLSTTHGGEMSGLGAFLQTVEEYRRTDVIAHLWSYGRRLVDGMNAAARDAGVEKYFSAEGFACSPYYVTRDHDGQISLPLRTLFSQEMIRNGVLMPWIALSLAHGDGELDATLAATRNALEVYRKALDEGVERWLMGRAIKPVFRKTN